MARIEFVPRNRAELSINSTIKAKITEFPSTLAKALPEKEQVLTDVKQSLSKIDKNSRQLAQEEQRKGLLSKVHVAKSQLMARLEGFDEAAYRAILENNFSTDSASKLNVYQLEGLVRYLGELGFTAKSRYNKPKLVQNKGRLDKIEALLAEKARHEGTIIPWEYALAILKTMTKGRKERLEQANSKELDSIIYALIKDAKRKGRYHTEWDKELISCQ